MNYKQKQRCIKIIFYVVIAAIVACLILYSLRQNINLYYTPHDIAQDKAPLDTTVRIGGMVVKGSVQRYEDLRIKFNITDFANNIQVEHQGILPDLFREGQGIVALGKIDNNKNFIAKEILAKHDEKYMPPEVAIALERTKNVN